MDAMLAQTFMPKNSEALFASNKEGRIYVQPKLDGVRALARIVDGKLVSIESRNGTDFSHLVPIFKKSIETVVKTVPKNIVVLDGELYVHGVPFQKLVSMVRNRSDAGIASSLEFHVYDAIDYDKKMGFEGRYLAYLRQGFLNPDILRVDNVVFVGILGLAKSMKDLDDYLDVAERDGYEGIMIRIGDRPYETGKRSSSLIKYKRFETDEFLIVGVKEAKGKDKGTPIFELQSNKQKSKKNVVFSARPMGTLEERKVMFEKRASLIGKHLTVKFQGLSLEGVPRFPVAVAVRDYE